MLYIISTPIGNLEDITLRALRLLGEVSLILCEDTRYSRRLLDHFGITTRLLSYHRFSEAEREQEVIQRLRDGEEIALISDAGSPGICDPGQRLIALCHREDLAMQVVPGPCAAIAALTLSGMETHAFQFLGFLPRKEGQLRRTLAALLHYGGVSVVYESPKRLLATLSHVEQMAPKRVLCVARELTKLHEECRVGTARELLEHWRSEEVRGEIVLLIGAADPASEWLTLTPKEHVLWLVEQYGLTDSDAIKLAAQLRGCPKKLIYAAWHET